MINLFTPSSPKPTLGEITDKNTDIKLESAAANASLQEASSVPTLRPLFWQRFALDELTTVEWEALCDGCGACCLVKFLEDYDDQTDVEYTDVACRLLDCDSGYCSNYADRQQYVPDCVSLTYDKLVDMMWLPSNCAYKRLYLGKDLPEWHLLITEDAVATQHGMRAAGVGVAGRCISEVGVGEEELEERVVTWIEVN